MAIVCRRHGLAMALALEREIGDASQIRPLSKSLRIDGRFVFHLVLQGHDPTKKETVGFARDRP
jgi:hypothetical protein